MLNQLNETEEPEPVRLRDALVQLSDERDTYLKRILGAWADGYRACQAHHGDQYEQGFADGVMALKRAQHDAHRLVELDARRWELRGEKRGRRDFGRPHKEDFGGIGTDETPCVPGPMGDAA